MEVTSSVLLALVSLEVGKWFSSSPHPPLVLYLPILLTCCWTWGLTSMGRANTQPHSGERLLTHLFCFRGAWLLQGSPLSRAPGFGLGRVEGLWVEEDKMLARGV